jgi:ribosomal protein L29
VDGTDDQCGNGADTASALEARTREIGELRATVDAMRAELAALRALVATLTAGSPT